MQFNFQIFIPLPLKILLLNTPKRILICPLDWGLGHASRCIPIIRDLTAAGFEVVIAADRAPFDLLSKEFPLLERLRFPAYKISYKYSMPLNMLISLPRILLGINKEHKLLAQIIRNCKIDLVISDNRFGLWNANIPCVFITHQLMIKCPPYLRFLEKTLHQINMRFVKKYSQTWVPDFQGTMNLSGDLSHRFPLVKNTFFIGPLSRFANMRDEIMPIEKFDVLIILSGPEPQRTIFENILLKQLTPLTNLKTIILRGLPLNKDSIACPAHVKIFPHLDSKNLFAFMNAATLIISRSGYSSIMDFAAIGKNTILVPTPGQTEQEYLAEVLKENKMAYSVSQNKFEMKTALHEAMKYQGIPKINLDDAQKPHNILSLVNEMLSVSSKHSKIETF